MGCARPLRWFPPALVLAVAEKGAFMFTTRNPISRRFGIGFAVVLAVLVLFGVSLVSATGVEAPVNVVAFANAPAAITVSWGHSGEGVYWFVLEQESPYAFTQMDVGKRVWTVVSLQPRTTYRYRVC